MRFVVVYSACVNPDVDELACNQTKESLHAKQWRGESYKKGKYRERGILYKLETGGKAEGHL